MTGPLSRLAPDRFYLTMREVGFYLLYLRGAAGPDRCHDVTLRIFALHYVQRDAQVLFQRNTILLG